MKVSELSPEFMEKKDENSFPKMDMEVTVEEAILGEWMIREKYNRKDETGNTWVNIPAYDTGENTDVVREILKGGTKPIGIVQTLVMREIIRQ